MDGEDNLAISCSCDDCDSLSCFEIRKYLNYNKCSCIKCETPLTCLYGPQKEFKYIEKTLNVVLEDVFKIVLEDGTESEVKIIKPAKKVSRKQIANEGICKGDNNEEIKTICKDVSDSKDKIISNIKEIYDSKDTTHTHSTTVTHSRNARNDSTAQLTAQVMNLPVKEIKYSIFSQKSVINVKFENQDLNTKEKEIDKTCSCKVCKCEVTLSETPQDYCKCERCDCEKSPENCKCETCDCETTLEDCLCEACDCETNQEDCKCEMCNCGINQGHNIKRVNIKDIEIALPDSFSYHKSNSSSCDDIKEYGNYEISSGVKYETPITGLHNPQKEFKYVEKIPNIIELIYDSQLEIKTIKPVNIGTNEVSRKQTQKQISRVKVKDMEYEMSITNLYGRQKEFEYVEKTPNVIELKNYTESSIKSTKPVNNTQEQARVKNKDIELTSPFLYSCNNIINSSSCSEMKKYGNYEICACVEYEIPNTGVHGREKELEYVEKTPNIIESKNDSESSIKSTKPVNNTQEQARVKNKDIEITSPLLYSCNNMNSSSCSEVKKYGNYEIYASVEYEIPNTGVHGREKEFKYIEKTPNIIELENESELKVESFMTVNNHSKKENINQETVKGDNIEQIIIIYKGVSHTKEKNPFNNKKVQSYSENVTRVQSMIITSSHKTSNDSAVMLTAQVMNVSIEEIKQYNSSKKLPKIIKLQKQDLYNKVKEIYKACSCKVCECKITSSKIPQEHCKCETCECGTPQKDCECDTCDCETTQEDCKCQTCSCGTTQDQISGVKTLGKEFTTPLSYHKNDSPPGFENRKYSNYVTCSCIDCQIPITCLYGPQKEVKYIEKTPNIIELENVIESEIKSIKPVNNNSAQKTTDKKTHKGENNGQIKIMYNDVSHSREKIYYKNKDKSHSKNITRVHSMTATYSRKASNDSAAKLAAQIMNVPIKEIKHSTFCQSPIDINLQKKDLYSKIKEIYKACSCKICECQVTQKHCKCVTCNCEKDVLNMNDKNVPHEGCPCIKCDRKDCKGVVKNIDLSSSCDCEPCDCLKCAESFNKPCDCTPCHCIECNFLRRAIKRNNITTAVVNTEQQNLCKCDPCECLNCTLDRETISPSIVDNMDIRIKKDFKCDNICARECQNNTSMPKEMVKSTRQYDIHRALVSETSAFYKMSNQKISGCDINALDTDPYTFSDTLHYKSNCHDNCKCQDCEYIVCEDKTLFSEESDFDKDFFFNNCECTPCECQICCKMKLDSKILLKEHKQNYEYKMNQGEYYFGKKSDQSFSDTCTNIPNIQKVISLMSNDTNIMNCGLLYENLSNTKNGELLSPKSFEANTNKYLSSHKSLLWKKTQKWNNVFDEGNINIDKNEKHGFITNYNIKEHVLDKNKIKRGSILNLRIKEYSNLSDVNNQSIKSVRNMSLLFTLKSIYESLVSNNKKEKVVKDNILCKAEKVLNDVDAYTEHLKEVLAKSQKDNRDFVSISEKNKEIQGPSYNIYDDNNLEIISTIAAFQTSINSKIEDSSQNDEDTTEKITDVESKCNINETKSNTIISRVEATQTGNLTFLVEKEVGCSSFKSVDESCDEKERFTEIRRDSDDAATGRKTLSSVDEAQGFELQVNGEVIQVVNNTTPVVASTPHNGMVVLTLRTTSQPSAYRTTTIAIILPSNIYPHTNKR